MVIIGTKKLAVSHEDEEEEEEDDLSPGITSCGMESVELLGWLAPEKCEQDVEKARSMHVVASSIAKSSPSRSAVPMWCILNLGSQLLAWLRCALSA